MARYLVGWNLIKEPPDESPREFPNCSEAKRFLRDELRWLAEDESDPEVADALFDAATSLEISSLTRIEMGHTEYYTAGVFEYWIRKETGQPPEAGFGGFGGFY